MAKQKSRPARWAEHASAARAATESIQEALDTLSDIFEEWRELQEEYQEWYDNMPDSFQSGPTGEKIDAVLSIDLEPSLDLLDDITAVIDEAEAAELPQGFGRD